ncbi:hypothetical protein CHKEEEPN_1629 [Methylorubrum podarium]|nr:hypothetical protein CHKEEEPN_1629 [Methylorubrum podarium]
MTSLPISLFASAAPMATLGWVPELLDLPLRFAETARATEVARIVEVSAAETEMPPVPAFTASLVPVLPSITAVVVVTILLPT